MAASPCGRATLPVSGCRRQHGPATARGTERVISPEVAFQMVSMLTDAIERGTAAPAARLGVRFPAEEDGNDQRLQGCLVRRLLFVDGRRRVGGVRPAEPIGADAYGSRYALPIWADFMQRAARIRRPEAFERPAGLHDEALCAITYLKPVDGCPLYSEYFKEGDDIPGRLCSRIPDPSVSASRALFRAGRPIRAPRPRHFPINASG